MMTGQYIHFRLDSTSELVSYPTNDIRELDWHEDLLMIQRFYRYWLPKEHEDIQPPAEDEQEVGNPIALVRNDEILSFAIPFSFKEGEIEIGAVATSPSEVNKGYCRRVICEMARRILDSGMCATLTTGPDNLAMRAAARSIGMREIDGA